MVFIVNYQYGQKINICFILFFYLLGIFFVVLVVVVFSFVFFFILYLFSSVGDILLLLGIVEVMCGLVMSMVFNFIDVLLKGNYIGILVWVIGFGFVLCYGNEIIKNLVNDMLNVVIFMVKLVICFVLIGIFGLVFFILVIIGFFILWGYV